MIWQSYREFKGGNFFETQCRTTTTTARTTTVTADAATVAMIAFLFYSNLSGIIRWNKSSVGILQFNSHLISCCCCFACLDCAVPSGECWWQRSTRGVKSRRHCCISSEAASIWPSQHVWCIDPGVPSRRHHRPSHVPRQIWRRRIFALYWFFCKFLILFFWICISASMLLLHSAA